MPTTEKMIFDEIEMFNFANVKEARKFSNKVKIKEVKNEKKCSYNKKRRQKA